MSDSAGSAAGFGNPLRRPNGLNRQSNTPLMQANAAQSDSGRLPESETLPQPTSPGKLWLV
eukprot:scaffold316489_cov50-Prasinocladus_malaysianus.AAC.2